MSRFIKGLQIIKKYMEDEDMWNAITLNGTTLEVAPTHFPMSKVDYEQLYDNQWYQPNTIKTDKYGERIYDKNDTWVADFFKD